MEMGWKNVYLVIVDVHYDVVASVGHLDTLRSGCLPLSGREPGIEVPLVYAGYTSR